MPGLGGLISQPLIPLSSSLSRRPCSHHHRHLLFPFHHKFSFTSSSLLKTQVRNPIRNQHKKFILRANNNNGDSSSEDEEETMTTTTKKKKEKEEGSRLNVGWADLLDPDPDNILAVGLTGVLAWASVQVLWQLCFISLAILLAALKYSFVAALLLFILIALL